MSTTQKERESEKRMKKVKVQISETKMMTFTTNSTFSERTHDKTLGYTKFHINKKHGIELKNIKINRKQLTVKVNNRIVLKPDAEKDGEYVYLAEAAEVKTEIKESMASWLAKMDGDGDDA